MAIKDNIIYKNHGEGCLKKLRMEVQKEKQKTLYLRRIKGIYMGGRVSTSETPFHMPKFTVYANENQLQHT